MRLFRIISQKGSRDDEKSNQWKTDGWIQMLRHRSLHLGGAACRSGAADDRAATERRDVSGKDVWVVLEYAEPVAVTRYEWYTADDTSRFGDRNPVAWRLQGSHDGKTWIDLDVVECAKPHIFDKTLAYSRQLDIPRELPENAIVYPMSVGGGRRLVSYEVNGPTIHELVPSGK